MPLLWPLKLQFWFVGNRSWRVPYGSPKEFDWFGAFCAVGALSTPLSVDGFNPWFHRLIPTPYGAVSDYLPWRGGVEVYAVVNGQNLLTREDIDGQRFRVIDAVDRETLLLEDAQGRAFTVGISEADNIYTAYIRVYRGNPVVWRAITAWTCQADWSATSLTRYRVGRSGCTSQRSLNLKAESSCRRRWATIRALRRR